MDRTMAQQAETPTREDAGQDAPVVSVFSPSIASSTVAARGAGDGGGGLEHQLRLLQSLHSSGLLDSEVFAKQQDALLNDWRHATTSQAVSVFDAGASKELASHCQRYAATPAPSHVPVSRLVLSITLGRFLVQASSRVGAAACECKIATARLCGEQGGGHKARGVRYGGGSSSSRGH